MRYILISIVTLFVSCLNIENRTQSLEEMKLYQVLPTAVKSEDQLSSKQYIMDYEVLNELSLSKKQQKDFSNALSNQGNFTTEELKKCVFSASYALVDGNTMIISKSECAKVMQIEQNGKIIIKDLVNGNELLPLLDEAMVK